MSFAYGTKSYGRLSNSYVGDTSYGDYLELSTVADYRPYVDICKSYKGDDKSYVGLPLYVWDNDQLLLSMRVTI